MAKKIRIKFMAVILTLAMAISLMPAVTLQAMAASPVSPTYSPANSATDVAVDVTPTLTFSEALYSDASGTEMGALPVGVIQVYEGTSNTGTALTEGIGSDNSHFTVAYNSLTCVFTVTFGADLKYGQSYYVELQADAVYNAAGNAIDTAEGVTFTTEAASVALTDVNWESASSYTCGIELSASSEMVTISVDSGYFTVPSLGAGVLTFLGATSGTDYVGTYASGQRFGSAVFSFADASDAETLLGGILYYPDGAAEQKIIATASTVSPLNGDLYFEGHFYRYVDSGTDIDWPSAVTAAGGTADPYFGGRGYIATATSQAENSILLRLTSTSDPTSDGYYDAWMGGLWQRNTGTVESPSITRGADGDEITYADLAAAKIAGTVWTMLKYYVTSYSYGGSNDIFNIPGVVRYYWIDGPEAGEEIGNNTGDFAPWHTTSGAQDEPNHGDFIYMGWEGAYWDDLNANEDKYADGYIVEFSGFDGGSTAGIVASTSKTVASSVSLTLGTPTLSGGKYYCSSAVVTGDGIRTILISFSKNIASGDAITLPSAAGFSVSATSNDYIKRINLDSGTSTSAVQSYLRGVGIALGSASQSVSVTVTTESIDTDTFYNIDTQHYYQYIPAGASGITWTDAYTAAEGMTYMGRTGYLATVMSLEEDTYLNALSGGKTGWLGGTIITNSGNLVDASGGSTGARMYYSSFTRTSVVSGGWYWACGPEIGTVFYDTNSLYDETDGASTAAIAAVADARNLTTYYNWSRGAAYEPNNRTASQSYGDNDYETCLTTLINAGHTGKQGTAFTWNDGRCEYTDQTSTWSAKGYFVEYGNKGENDGWGDDGSASAAFASDIGTLHSVYAITYNLDGGTNPGGAPAVYTYGTGATLPTPTKTGFTFVGWYTDSGFSGSTVATISPTDTGAKEYWAKWTASASSGGGSSAKTITVTETSSDLFDGSSGDILAETNMESAFSSSVEVKVTDTDQEGGSFGFGAGTDVYPFDISLYIKGTNTKTEPASGYAVTISLPVPEDLLDVREQLSVVHRSDDGTVTVLTSSLEQINGVWYLVFDATEFSPYALVVRNLASYDMAAGLPYYLDGSGGKVFIGFAADGKYLAPEGKTVLFTPNPKDFNDISGHWAKSYIDFVTEREIFVGMDESIFSPDGGMTRAMFAAVIGRLYERSYGDIGISDDHAFTDCDYDDYYGKYVDWAAENGIILGYGDGRFGPGDRIIREQMAAILYRFADFLGVLPNDMDIALTYPDAGDISDWGESAARYCQSTGIISGRDGGNFVPQSTATRAEAAAILERFIAYVV